MHRESYQLGFLFISMASACLACDHLEVCNLKSAILAHGNSVLDTVFLSQVFFLPWRSRKMTS